ncbi:DNA-binding transcriptional activator of the SARP family [Lentzea albidocapillata subsp. violacea]|uniref:DNA-binding transcriptional activator of the SARP family n=1 Tax=Lentzea albidocapillata subsp. violacea TaxID=128104 RepID=A0A1G8SG52_9PSEU|nr:AfsR/SARP family transcriptional regulator [Lentzea albidocapillata]SDJ27745.1 DNA-binding transcriptional activator of the SARP family [Lentzea albidocapillata subsp. violacea]
MSPGRFRVLGPVEVDGPGSAARIPPGRQQVILGLLLVEANRMVSTETLVDALWQESPPDTARTQVQICVSRLRRTLHGAGMSAVIDTRPPGYQLRLNEDTLDLADFLARTAEARVLVKEGRTAEAAALLREAAALWRGPCLGGAPNRSLHTRALRLDEDRLTCVEDHLELELELGQHHQLVGEVTRLVHEHPLRERPRALLMIALHRSGRQAEALDVYRAGRTQLIEELGLEPGERLRALEAAILAGEVPDQSRADPAPRDSGTTRTARPRQLPADTADFVGDEEMLRGAESVLVGGAARTAVGVVVITGRPGVGKSTVAAHLAHRVAHEHFPDGQLYCALHGTGQPSAVDDVLGRFLLALGIPGPVIPDGLDARLEMYRTLLADRRVLVVLDDAATEGQVLPLLPGSSTCAVVVTSRSRLTGLPGARQVELDVLDAGQSLRMLGLVVGEQRVAREPEAAAALVRTVGGLPLALRIIAARLAARPHWTLASMVLRLASERHRLDELAHGELTIRASLGLTHDGLDRRSRLLFGLLSLTDGPVVPGWVAGAVLDDDRPFPSDLLEPLVDVQVLDVVSVEPTGEFRYRYQDVLRLFAREKAEQEIPASDRAAAVSRLLGGWLALAEQAHRSVYGGDYTVLHGTAPRWQPAVVPGDPLEWMDGELENLCAAIHQAAAAGLDELCWDLAVTSVTLFESRGYLDDWERTHAEALAAVRAAGNTRGTAAVLSSLGTLHINRGRLDSSRSALLPATELFEELGDVHGLALCHRDLALIARNTGDDTTALSLYDRSLAGFTAVDDIVGRAIVLTQRAFILATNGEIAQARTDLAEAMAVHESVGYTGGAARTLNRIGQVQAMAGEHAAATTTMRRVLDMVRDTRDVIGEGQLLRNLGQVSAAAGRYAEARTYLEQALSIRERILDRTAATTIRAELAALPGQQALAPTG